MTMNCSQADCDKAVVARGWCRMHYSRWHRYGDPLIAHSPDRPSAADRFWEKVDASGDCWEWTGARQSGGYGNFWYEGRHVLAHRFAWELLVGAIPEDLTLDHLCRNRACVDPDHLEVITMKENLRRGFGAPHYQRNKTHCPRGHAYTEENIYWTAGGGRACRQCVAERVAA